MATLVAESRTHEQQGGKRNKNAPHCPIPKRFTTVAVAGMIPPAPEASAIVPVHSRMMPRLHDRNEWMFFSVMLKASPGLAAGWWLLGGLRGVLPAVSASAVGTAVRSVS